MAGTNAIAGNVANSINAGVTAAHTPGSTGFDRANNVASLVAWGSGIPLALSNSPSSGAMFTRLSGAQAGAIFNGLNALQKLMAGEGISTADMAAFAGNLALALADYAALAGSAEAAATLSNISAVASAFAAGYGVGSIIYDHWGMEISDAIWDFFHPDIDPTTNDTYLDARRWIAPRDPLALDLDGDGIETTGINGDSGTVLFDHDGDGVLTGTGWVKGDDGFLVWDRNGNGTIDNGHELFGVDTLKQNGQYATDGIDALADLDSNGDGVFDASDAHFADVRVWRDLNQDGISQAGELSTLAEHGIVSIGLASESAIVNLNNGNIQTASTTYTRADGSEDNTSSLDLSENPFYRKFTDTILLTGDTLLLPDIQGSGAVWDLREAAQSSPTLAAQLTALLEAGHIDRAEYRARIVELIDSWAGSANFYTSREVAESVPELNDYPMFVKGPKRCADHAAAAIGGFR